MFVYFFKFFNFRLVYCCFFFKNYISKYFRFYLKIICCNLEDLFFVERRKRIMVKEWEKEVKLDKKK